MSEKRKQRLAFVVSHPIQYQAPFFIHLAKDQEIDLTVYYSWDFGVRSTYDPEFQTKVQWDIPILEGYYSVFPKNISPRPSSSHSWGEINPGIITEIVRGHFDAVIVHGWHFWTNWFAFTAAFLTGTPFFVHGENPLSQEFAKNPLKKIIKKIILGTLFKAAKGCLFIGEENKKFYEYYGVPSRKLFFVPHMVDNDRFTAAAKGFWGRQAELKQELGFSSDTFLVLTAGKLIQKKRPLDLLTAFKNMSIENKALVYLGDGELRGQMERRVREENIPNVLITGFKNQTKMPQVYAAADVFVLASEAGETWGLVLNEAMCFNLPLVVADMVGASKDLVHSSQNGFVFQTGDITALEEHLKKLARDPNLRHRMGQKSAEIVQGYSFEVGINGIKTALKSLF